MNKLTRICAASALVFASNHTFAADVTIEIQNLTQGMYFTPIAAVAHTPDASLFELGEEASPEIQEMAEGGSLAGLTTIATSISADVLAEPTAGPLEPTQSVSGSFMTADGNTVLSVVPLFVVLFLLFLLFECLGVTVGRIQHHHQHPQQQQQQQQQQ